DFFGRIVALHPGGNAITTSDRRESQKRNCRLPAPQAAKACNLKTPLKPKNRLSLNRLVNSSRTTT
ncbi:MAG: hypothetical protein KGK16_10205, partial [Bradyrhizobium sp.]|nr:hypothetical protein [Bradyrhizobium sp.]